MGIKVDGGACTCNFSMNRRLARNDGTIEIWTMDHDKGFFLYLYLLRDMQARDVTPDAVKP